MKNTECKEWPDLHSFFRALNEKCEYIVVRNFEDLFGDFTKGGHQDIDFLCSDRELFIEAGGCIPRLKKNDPIHRKVTVGGREIPVDLRTIGDGYYDTRWEQDMIKNRRVVSEVIYAPSAEDYYYSLLYHVLIQKKKTADDYRLRLGKMAEELGLEAAMDKKELIRFMKEKGYLFTYPENPKGIFNHEDLPQEMIEINKKRIFMRKLARLL